MPAVPLQTAKVRTILYFIFLVLASSVSRSQTYTTIAVFNQTNGRLPYGNLIQATDGNFYGTTYLGGTSDLGTVFRLTSKGVITTLYSFTGTNGDGIYPKLGLLQASDGNLYGVTSDGGDDECGTIFRITLEGVLTTVYQCAGGPNNADSLIEASNHDLYGTSVLGGTIFEMTLAGDYSTLLTFDGNDGGEPTSIMQGTDGNLYGTAESGGDMGYGTIFKITLDGSFSTLFYFDGTDGSTPAGQLIQALDGDFYGTTYDGTGAALFGTAFKITPEGSLTTLHRFGGADGASLDTPLVQATDGNFYSEASSYYDRGPNTIFQMTPAGAVTVLHDFGTGQAERNGLIQSTDGNFYGTTNGSDRAPYGTAFRLSMGLGPFVKTQTTAGNVGTPVVILGTDLTGATGVTFNGAAASFTVLSASEITAIVPTGATTGTIQVNTPNGTLNSNVPFRVTP
ncbi:MAG TPA: choice-of-anchor tandem repeat GloVer-containing protein [Terriglobales bacterium]|nr:choice-of-anchor tandem repeat GloVer-containing protein [Terriglobales bacterium]